MKEPIIFIERGLFAGEILLEQMTEQNIISEAFNKKLKAVEMIKEEWDSSRKVMLKGKQIAGDIFSLVYKDYKNYETRFKILSQFGFTLDDFGDTEQKQKENMKKTLNRLISQFNSMAESEDEVFPKYVDRKRFYVSKARKESGFEPEEDGVPEANIDNIEGGSRAPKQDKTSRILQRINQEDLLQGEFYANRTRIPKTRWSSWIRFWDRKKSSVARDKSVIGREWAKTFIFGYQIEPNLLYEIWYNSIDSTFTVHDSNGGEISGRSRTMTEAVKNLINMVSQSSSIDAAVFRGSSVENRQISQSITRALFNQTDDRAVQLMQLDAKKQKEAKAERRMKIKERQDKKNRAKDRKKRAKDYIMRQSGFDKTPPDKNAFNDVGQDDIPERKQQNSQSSFTGEKEYKWKHTPNEELRKKYDRELEKTTRREQEKKRQMQQAYDDIPVMKPEEDGLDDIPEFTREYNKERQEKAKEERKKRQMTRKPNLSVNDIGDREKEVRSKIQRAKDNIKKSNKASGIDLEDDDKAVNENMDMDGVDNEMELSANEVKRKTQSSAYDSEIKKMRTMADKSPFTQNALKGEAGGQVDTYDKTRVGFNFGQSGLLPKFLNRGRSEPIVLPTDEPSTWEKVKMAWKGTRYRADFIIGFSLVQKVNVEIWCITEPNPEYTGKMGQAKAITTYYVFDVTSGRILRKYLPYYRNAIQVVMGKISTF